MAGLLVLDEAAFQSVTKGKKTMNANVMFCRLMGAVFILVGVASLLGGRRFWPVTGFLVVAGLAMIFGSLIYAKALRENKNPSS